MPFRDINPAPLNPLAYGEMVGNIGTNILAGEERGMRDALLMDRIGRDVATRNALAGYFEAPEAERGARLNDLVAADPKTAASVLEIQAMRREIEMAQRKEQALKEYTAANAVLKSDKPALALRLLDSDGTFLKQLHDAGLIDSSDGISDDEARIVAEWARDQTAPIAGIVAEPDSFSRKLATVKAEIGRPLTDEEVLKMAGGGTTINIGDKLNEPIPISQIDSVRLPDGNPVPIGTTFEQARALGAQVQSPDEQKRRAQADAALGVLGELEELALGPSGVFTNVEPGFVNRAAAAITHALDMATQNNPESSRYEDLSKSTLAPFIKMLGESGALAEGDVSRALGLLPRNFPLPDTKQVAREKLRALREIVTRGIRNFNSTASAATSTSSLPPLPPGFTLDEPQPEGE